MRPVFIILLVYLLGCTGDATSNKNTIDISINDKMISEESTDTSLLVSQAQLAQSFNSSETVITGSTSPQDLLTFANTLIGIPYKYGSIDPSMGFDCSGFITYVFNHFNIAVPRSSINFTNVQTEIPLQQAKPGDLILFTGTDSTIKKVGHMGIITSANNNEFSFIHSTSGKADGVTVTQLNQYYLGRFIKVIRVFR